MANLTDLIITQEGADQSDQIVDSYDLIKGILVDFEGQANFIIKLDNTLPIINGNPKHLGLLFNDFIRKAIKLFKGLSGQINITHIKDSKSWIFGFFIVEFQNEGQKRVPSTLAKKVGEFNLAISKNNLSNKVGVILSLENK